MAPGEFDLDIFEGDSLFHQGHQKVIHKVGSFFDKALAGIILGRDDGLDGFLAEFLDDLVDSLREEFRGVTSFRPLLLAPRDDVV
jgi:hypothetical protein